MTYMQATHSSRAAFLLLATGALQSGQCQTQQYAWQQEGQKGDIAGLGDNAKYASYVAAQYKKFERKVDGNAPVDWAKEWKKYDGALGKFGGVSRDSMQQVADYVRENIPLANKFALCHGTNRGFEMAYLREMLPGVEVWGTEMAPTVAKLSNWTINWDFHVVKPEWRDRADFVYTNALDHSPTPVLAVQRWMEEVSRKGALIIEWSRFQERRTHSPTDPFGASYAQLYEILHNAGKGKGFRLATTFNSSATYHKKSFSYRMWYVLKHRKKSATEH